MYDPWPSELAASRCRRAVTYTPPRRPIAFPNCLKLTASDIPYADFKTDASDLRIASKELQAALGTAVVLILRLHSEM